MQSFVVSDSGSTLTLGKHHITSSGVQEFREESSGSGSGSFSGPASGAGSGKRLKAAEYQLELQANSNAARRLRCDHVTQLDLDNGFQIGRGSSGHCYNVLHIPSGLRVCVKQMQIDDARHRDEIKRELDSLHKTSSRFIVDFYGAFFHNDIAKILLVLELMEGSLHEVLKLKGRLTELQTKAFALQVVSGLKFLHSERHLIHRDIKPANLLFHRSGQVKITDFGVSTGQRSTDPRSVLTFVGSILYMSPERLEAKSYSYECDIWSLGITLCETVTGYHPYQEDFAQPSEPLNFWGLLQKVHQADPERHRSPVKSLLAKIPADRRPTNISDAVDDFVSRCLAYDKNQRSSAEELLSHEWLASMTIEESERIIRDLALEVVALRGGGGPMSRQGSSGGPPISLSSPEKREPVAPLEPSLEVQASTQLFTPSSKSRPSGGNSPETSPSSAANSRLVPAPSQQATSSSAQPQQPQPSVIRPAGVGTSSGAPNPADTTPSSLTPEEKRKRSDALLNELLSSVKR
jgi:serine/threonine protein kinase